MLIGPQRLAIVLVMLGLMLSFAVVPVVEPGAVRAAQQTGTETTENDDRDEIVLLTAGVVVAAGVVVTVGYLYRRQIGLVGHYDDGFTPRDPRDHATH